MEHVVGVAADDHAPAFAVGRASVPPVAAPAIGIGSAAERSHQSHGTNGRKAMGFFTLLVSAVWVPFLSPSPAFPDAPLRPDNYWPYAVR